MRIKPKAKHVRRLVVEAFEAFGGQELGPLDLEETLLIDAGRCAARSYRAGPLMAMWLVDVGVVQFYDAEGNMLATRDFCCDPQPMRKAA